MQQRSSGCCCRLLMISAHLVTLYRLFKGYAHMEDWHLPHHPHRLGSWTAYLTQLRIFSIQGTNLFTFYCVVMMQRSLLFWILLVRRPRQHSVSYNQSLNSIPKNLQEHFLPAR